MRLLQIDPNDAAKQIGGGPRGLWRSSDGSKTWSQTNFEGDATPQIFAIELDPGLGWGRLWIASDNGLYASSNQGETARAAGLAGERVTALARGATSAEMFGVVDKSKVVRFDPDMATNVETLELAPLPEEARQLEFSLHSFVRALHFGHGLFGVATSRLINDAGGLAMCILALTGLLYWGFRKWWRIRAAAGAPSVSPEAKRSILAWLYRIHAATTGILISPVLLYMALTGVIIDHDRELGGWLRSVVTPRAMLTPAFDLASWDERIDALIGYPDAPGVFSVGNVYGMFTTADGGKNWAREADEKGEPIGGARGMRRIGNQVLIMGGNGATAVIRGDDFSFHEASLAPPEGMGPATGSNGAHHRQDIAGAAPDRGQMRTTNGGGMNGRFAPSDVSTYNGGLLWRTNAKLVVTDLHGDRLRLLDATPPEAPGVPIYMWLRSIHTGVLLWSEWRYDAFGMLALFLTVTGVIRWWRLKWV